MTDKLLSTWRGLPSANGWSCRMVEIPVSTTTNDKVLTCREGSNLLLTFCPQIMEDLDSLCSNPIPGTSFEVALVDTLHERWITATEVIPTLAASLIWTTNEPADVIGKPRLRTGDEGLDTGWCLGYFWDQRRSRFCEIEKNDVLLELTENTYTVS